MKFVRKIFIVFFAGFILITFIERTQELNRFSTRISHALLILETRPRNTDSFINYKNRGYEELKNVILESSNYEPPFPIRGISLSPRDGVFFCMIGPGGRDFYQGIAALDLVKSWVDQSKIFVFFGEYYGGSEDHFCDMNHNQER